MEHTSTGLSDISEVDVVQGVAKLLSYASLGRQAACRLWKGSNQTLYKLPAPTFSAFDAKVRKKFDFGPSETDIISYYYITNRKDIGIREYIANNEGLDNYFEVAGNPTIYIWLSGASQSSPESLPSQIQTKVASDEASDLSECTATRGNQQAAFRKALRDRDNNACVLSDTKLVEKAGNIEAAHIFGVEGALKDMRRAAGVLNSYDTVNGMLLEKSLHVAFDSYQWCMDADGVVSVADDAIPCTLARWKDKKMKLKIGESNFPTKDILQARYDLFSSKCVLRKNAQKKKKRGKAAFTV